MDMTHFQRGPGRPTPGLPGSTWVEGSWCNFFWGDILVRGPADRKQSEHGGKKGTLLRKLWPSPCREEPILGHPDGVEAALPGAYKYVSTGHWSCPSDSQACGVVGGHQNQLDSGGARAGEAGAGRAWVGLGWVGRQPSLLRSRDQPFSPGSGQPGALGLGQWK